MYYEHCNSELCRDLGAMPMIYGMDEVIDKTDDKDDIIIMLIEFLE
jgi:hypothetical protein